MVAKTEVLDALKSIGLNLYERNIYVALLAKGVATAAEVSEIAAVPRSRSYDVLESLAEKGFVIVQHSKPIKYVALKPSEAMERTKDVLTKKHEEILSRIDRVSESTILTELEKIHTEGLSFIQPTDMTGTLKGSRLITMQLQSMLKKATAQVEILTTEKGMADIHSNHFRTLKKLAKRGIKIKIAGPFKDHKVVKQLSEVADVRNIRAPVGRVAVVDGKHLLMALTEDTVHESQDMALWTTSEHAVQSMAAPLFSQVWKDAK
ncbi:MAG: TrmB family transcriptional regulator [Candidatus Aenigmarchaeota archaeon]|nr:TrmB family transcriptional regulator [Candidatus Aenigmarchaeota archaeon]